MELLSNRIRLARLGIAILMGAALCVPAAATAGSVRASGAGTHGHGTISITVQVSSAHPWTDTGIDLSVGAKVDITANGSITFVPGQPYSYGPTGDYRLHTDPTYIAPNLIKYSLLARLGSNLPFEVGEHKRFVAKAAGRLTLGVNDSYFADNSGNWTATVRVQS